MDERNFHCWNYRFWVVDIYLKQMKTRGIEKEEEQILKEYELPLIKRECEMAFGLINKNFSNFSAWHYRAKLLPKIYNDNDRK